MKFFHISDLHIGKQLHHYNMLEEQRDILQQIVNLVEREKPDALLIAGDIYDVPVPSAEAVSVLDGFLSSLHALKNAPVICMIAGNHDSAKRIDFASSILEKHQVHIAGMPPTQPEHSIKKVEVNDAFGKVNIYLLPFVKPGYVRNIFEEEITSYDMAVRKLIAREEINEKERNILVSHQFYTAGGKEPEISDSEVHMVGGIENIDASILDVFEYAALGHIHRKQKMGREENRYCGTPLQYSVSEAGDEKSVTMVELCEKGKTPIITELPLIPKRKVRKMVGELAHIMAEATEENRHDFVSITLTDEVEAYHPKELLEECYDHILEIKIDNARTRHILEFDEEELQSLEPLEAFSTFFTEMNGREMIEEEKAFMQEVVNQQKGEM